MITSSYQAGDLVAAEEEEHHHSSSPRISENLVMTHENEDGVPAGETTPLQRGDGKIDSDGYFSVPTFKSRGRRRSPSRGGRFALMALFGVSMVIVVGSLVLPSREELDLAREYDVNGGWFGGGVRRVRSAQKLADLSRIFLSQQARMVPELRDAYRDIRHDKHAAKQYAELPEGCEATVVIVRHCEKGHVREHCAHIGYERSVFLSTLFGDSGAERWPAPSYIFAEGPGHRKNKRKMNFREIETVGPLAAKLGLDVDDRCVSVVLIVLLVDGDRGTVTMEVTDSRCLNLHPRMCSFSTKTVNHLSKKILTFLQTGEM